MGDSWGRAIWIESRSPAIPGKPSRSAGPEEVQKLGRGRNQEASSLSLVLQQNQIREPRWCGGLQNRLPGVRLLPRVRKAVKTVPLRRIDTRSHTWVKGRADRPDPFSQAQRDNCGFQSPREAGLPRGTCSPEDHASYNLMAGSWL